MALPLTIDCPNLSPNPVNACAAAASVRFNLTGSTFSTIELSVSNNVLNSVVTDLASITCCGVMRCGVGFFGEVNDTYLLPNTVVALILASTLAGISLMYFGFTSKTNLAAGMPSRWISEMLATRPISTPL